jgi:hypothetical protein
MVIDQSAEILRLRATVRDLLALSIIPEAWVARDPPAIAADVADLLIGSLKLDFAFVRLCDPRGYQAVEVIREGISRMAATTLRQLRSSLSNRNREQCWRGREILLRCCDSYWSQQRARSHCGGV